LITDGFGVARVAEAASSPAEAKIAPRSSNSALFTPRGA
jgi:hypothetical protein